MATFVVLMQGPSVEEAEPILYSEDIEGISALLSALSAKASAGLMPEQILSELVGGQQDTRPTSSPSQPSVYEPSGDEISAQRAEIENGFPAGVES